MLRHKEHWFHIGCFHPGDFNAQMFFPSKSSVGNRSHLISWYSSPLLPCSKPTTKILELRVCKSIRGWVKGFFFGLSKLFSSLEDIALCWEVWCSFRRHTAYMVTWWLFGFWVTLPTLSSKCFRCDVGDRRCLSPVMKNPQLVFIRKKKTSNANWWNDLAGMNISTNVE